ncbi:uncharacterized protein B0J16DRAFT_333100 [Fusarium flagelliforme]|uniref:uncharacterized protein n=1 Tax=Fusarium flagelliforme TaxID=2675880 RepID=UPI001E8DBC4C|nr:uncharacterized protein B0J16DRAFT_333100 [Fusarium flagelliforme]KAH7192448.1 hypothetical protein B0J16DRAFT_333100 [Fusarium flagelliforme]
MIFAQLSILLISLANGSLAGSGLIEEIVTIDQLPVALSNSVEYWIELSPYRLPMYRGSGTFVLNFLIIGAHIQSRLGLYLAKYSTGLSKFCFFFLHCQKVICLP